MNFPNLGLVDSTYKTIQRECDRKSKAVYVLRQEFQVPGTTFKDMNGRTYRIAKDGSHRKIDDLIPKMGIKEPKNGKL